MCVGMLPLGVLAYYPSYRALFLDFDLWFHLAYGQHFVQNLTTTIDHAQFSWTPAQSHFPYNTWLGSSVLYLIHHFFGVPGLFGLHYAVLFATGAVVWQLGRAGGLRLGIGFLTAILFTAIGIRTAANFIKPEMFSILLTALIYAAYLRFRMDPGRWLIIVWPVLFVIWVNTHGLWIFGITLLLLLWGVDLILYAARSRQALSKRSLIHLTLAVLLSFLALFINPYSPEIPAEFLRSLISQVPSILLPLSDVENQYTLGAYRAIAEYQSLWPYLSYDRIYDQTAHFMGVTAGCSVAMILFFMGFWLFSWKHSGCADLPLVVSNITFFGMAMTMSRLVLVFGIVWVLSLVFLTWRTRAHPVLTRAAPLLVILFGLLILYISFAAVCIYHNTGWFGKGYQDYIPDREAEYILANRLSGPMFNDYLSGGYLIWHMYPKYRVFLDSRHFPYLDQVFPDYRSIGTQYSLNIQGLEQFTTTYPFNFALIHRRYQHLIEWFYSSPEWTLVYFDTVAVVMLRTDLVPQLSQNAREQSMRGPLYYRNVTNPIVFEHLFNVYINFVGIEHARQIRDLFEQNISNWYWHKQTALNQFDNLLRVMEQRKQISPDGTRYF